MIYYVSYTLILSFNHFIKTLRLRNGVECNLQTVITTLLQPTAFHLEIIFDSINTQKTVLKFKKIFWYVFTSLPLLFKQNKYPALSLRLTVLQLLCYCFFVDTIQARRNLRQGGLGGLQPPYILANVYFLWIKKIVLKRKIVQNCKSTILDETVETKLKIYFSVKKTLSPKTNVLDKVLGFWQQKLSRFNIDLGGKGENLEFKKLSHFLNLLDFQLLSQQVLSRVVGSF